jgi:hypothetical protein
MIEEIHRDIAAGELYHSPWLNPAGRAAWADLLLQAAREGDDESLAASLRTGLLNEMAERRNPKGGTVQYRVPGTAPETMAGEFNLFYIRALCRRAIEGKIPHLVIYRARHSDKPRPDSEALIGKQIDPAETLADLRSSQGQAAKLGFPPGPNSGLTARLP